MKTDMSPEAIDARLRLTTELLNLCLSLGKAQPLASDPNEQKAAEQKTAAAENQ